MTKALDFFVSKKDHEKTADLMTIRKYEIFSGVWRGLFEPSTAPSRPERERVLTDTIKTGFYKIQKTY